nr:cell division protein FtsZ [Gammaproteobacteria bacterium]
ITAGEDVTLGEYNDILERANDLSSENATVVVGTVIDPSLEDILRVTVVATGLSLEDKPMFIPVEVDQPEKNIQKIETKTSSGGEINWAEIERPTILRNGNKLSDEDADPDADKDLSVDSGDYLDIPAFLRCQAD